MSRKSANFLLLIAALLWGIGNVAQQTILEDIGPFTAVGLRCLVAALVVLPFTLRKVPTPAKLDNAGKKLALKTITLFAISVTLLQIGFGLTTVTNAGFLVNTVAVITPLVAFFVMRQKISTMVWPAAFIILLGAGLMSSTSAVAYGLGDILCLAAAVSYSFWMIYLGQFVIRYGHALRLTFTQFTVAGLACLSIGMGFEPISAAGLQNALPELLLLGVFSTGFGYLLQAVAQQDTSASEAAIITSAEAVFGAIGGYLVLGETLNLHGALGAALIFGGILLVQLPQKPAPRLAPTSHMSRFSSYAKVKSGPRLTI